MEEDDDKEAILTGYVLNSLVLIQQNAYYSQGNGTSSQYSFNLGAGLSFKDMEF